MRSYLSFAWKELKAQRVMSVLIFIAAVMSTAMTAAIGQSAGVLQAMRGEQAAMLNGSRYATFYEMTGEQAELLHRDERLYDVGDWLTVGTVELADSGVTLFLREYHDRTLSMYPGLGRVKEGRLPEREGEIALPEDALQYLGWNVSVGDSVTLELSAASMDGLLPDFDFTGEFVLTAILESNYLGYSTGIVTGIAGSKTAKSLLPEEYLLYATDFKTRSKSDFQAVVHELAAALGVEERHIQYNWILLDALGISYDGERDPGENTGFSFMMLACLLVGILVLLAAGLVIYNILKISVAKRIREYGTLRALGGEKGQIYRLVSLTADRKSVCQRHFDSCAGASEPGTVSGRQHRGIECGCSLCRRRQCVVYAAERGGHFGLCTGCVLPGGPLCCQCPSHGGNVRECDKDKEAGKEEQKDPQF